MKAEDIKEIIKTVLSDNGKDLDTDFVFGEFMRVPNTQGIFLLEDKWFIYETDEKNVLDINGPFTAEEIIYAIAMMLYEIKVEWFEKYKFGSEALHTYIHSHFTSIEDAEKFLSQ